MGIRKPGELYAAVESLLEDQRPENMYDAETDVQLAAKDQVDVLLDFVRPAVLLDFLAKFAADHRTTCDEEWPEIDRETANKFLAGLDKLRKPLPSELDMAHRDAKADLLTDSLKRVDALSRLPWSGDLTYGQALDDVRSALLAAADGKPTPTPDWLRCPSEYQANKHVKVRCEKSLPHGDYHHFTQGDGKGVSWTDEDSTTPPPYCPSEHTFTWGPLKGKTFRCAEPEGHDGEHLSAGGSKWTISDQTIAEAEAMAPTCAAFRTTAGLTLRCDLPAGHTGEHQDDGSMGRWS